MPDNLAKLKALTQCGLTAEERSWARGLATAGGLDGGMSYAETRRAGAALERLDRTIRALFAEREAAEAENARLRRKYFAKAGCLNPVMWDEPNSVGEGHHEEWHPCGSCDHCLAAKELT